MNPEDSKQFDEIMGRNFSQRDESAMTGRAMGEQLWNRVSEIFGTPQTDEERKAHQTQVFLARAKHFPTSMIHEDEHGDLHIKHTESDGWSHVWHGGPIIDHHHPAHGAIDVTNMHDYSAKWGEQPYEKGEFTPEQFFNHIDEFNKDSKPFYD